MVGGGAQEGSSRMGTAAESASGSSPLMCCTDPIGIMGMEGQTGCGSTTTLCRVLEKHQTTCWSYYRCQTMTRQWPQCKARVGNGLLKCCSAAPPRR